MRALLLALWLAASAQAADPGPSDALWHDGDALWDRGEVAAALVSWSQGMAEAQAERDPVAEVELGLRVAAALRNLGRMESADTLLTRLEGLTKGGAPAARVMVARGQWQLAGGRLKAAARTLEGAFRAAQEASAPQVALNAAVALGDARAARNELDGARKAWSAADTLADALEDRIAQADVANRAGLLQRRTGELASAHDSLVRALELYRGAGELVGEADAEAGLASVLADLGRVPDALALVDSALATARDRRDVTRQASLLARRGSLAARLGDLTSARSDLMAARDAFRGVQQHGAAAGAVLDLALIEQDVEGMRDAVEAARSAGDELVEARARMDLALALEATEPSSAVQEASQAAALAEKLALSSVLWRARGVQGRALLADGRSKAGIEALRLAVDELERTRLRLDPGGAQDFALASAPVYTALVDALLAEGERVDAFLYAQRLQLVEVAPPDDPEAARYQELVAEEAWLARALGVAEARGGEGDEQARALREQLAALRMEFAGTVDELRASYDRFDELVRVDPEDLEAVQGDLPEGVVVLQPVVLPSELVLMVVTSRGLEVVRTSVQGPDLLRDQTTVLMAMRFPGMFPPADTTAALERLGAALVAPIAEHLDGAEILVVSKSGELRQLPFAILRHDGRYLVEDLALASITHVGSLRRHSATAPRDRLTGPGLLLVGNPDGSLPGAEAEVHAIAAAMPGATVLVGSAGTEQALQDRVGGKQALHLATHGWVDLRHPMDSFLTLAVVDERSPRTDGRLSYGEIPGLGAWLDAARLVVLSACESAVPVDASGRLEEDGSPTVSINGLAAQFRRAGVETLVASLWKVDDAGTQRLMEGLYAELARGTDVARALRSSQLALLAEEEWADPFFWGAFVVVGDWR